MAGNNRRFLSFREQRDLERAQLNNAKAKRKEALAAVDERFSKIKSDVDSDHDRKMKEFSDLYHAAGVDREKQKQANDLIEQEKKSYKIQLENIKSAKSQATRRAEDLSQYKGSSGDVSDTARQIANEEVNKQQERSGLMDNRVTDSLKSYFDRKRNSGQKTVYTPGMADTSNAGLFPDADFGDKGKANLGMFGSVPLTDEQKKQIAEDEKAKKEEKGKAAVARTGGAAFDSQNLQFGTDENGNPTFKEKDDNKDLTYRPAIVERKVKAPEENNGGEYQDFGLGSYFARRLMGDTKDPMGRSGHLNRQAEMHDIQAGDQQRAMQQNLQIANRDYRSEAEKNAASQAAAENAQKVHNLGNAGAGSAALERDVKAADYNTMMQRSDEQRRLGVENMEKMHDMRQTAEQERAGADVYDYTARDMAAHNLLSDWLSMGGPGLKWGRPANNAEPEEEVEQEQPPVPEEEEEEVDERIYNANPQDVINVYLGAWQADDNKEATAPLGENEQALFDYLQKKFPNVKPVPSAQSVRKAYYGKLGVLGNMDAWENAWLSRDDEYGKASDKKELVEMLRTWRGGGDKSVNYERGKASQQVKEKGNVVSNKPGESEWTGATK